MSWEGLNRRKFPRAGFPCLVKIGFGSALTDAFLTHTENISTGGVCIILKNGLDRLSLVEVEIDLMDGDNHIFCQGKVAWVVRRKAIETHKPAAYDTGIEFFGLTKEDAGRLKQIVEYIVKNVQKEKS